MQSIKEQIKELSERLRQLEYEYYVLNKPTVSDFEFDQLMKQLEAIESEHPDLIDPQSPSHRVGSDLLSSFQTLAHSRPMLSLGNTYNFGELEQFYYRTATTLGERFDLVAELKFDGVSISLLYEHGVLIRALTRGDGTQGDDVTANVRSIKSVPLKLRGNDWPESLEVRGEILLPFSEFERINQERIDEGLEPFANPRNAAAGSLKQLNPKIVAKRRLDAYFYYAYSSELRIDSHSQRLDMLSQWGLKVSKDRLCSHSFEEIKAFIQYWDQARSSLPVATDGIVLKVDSLVQQEELGITSKSPRWAIAYKYQAERAHTKLLAVTYQVGRTGAITPVANLDPVLISGSTVRRASLHNADFIQELDLHDGDYVYVEKGGEIIPKIVEVDLDKRAPSASPIVFTTHCPDCNTPLERLEGEAVHYCPNADACPMQQKGLLEHFATRKAADIRIGPETIQLLYSKALLKNVADYYDLKAESLLGLPGFQQKAASKLIESIESSKKRPYSALLFALGIRMVGETVAKKLADQYPSIELLMSASEEELQEIDEIGSAIAKSVRSYFASEKHIELVNRLIAAGLRFEHNEEQAAKGDKLSGKVIVISGSFSHHSRDEYKAMVEREGGRMASSISSKTSFVLMGTDMGPSKRAKAESLGIDLVDEDNFLKMLNT